MQQARLVRSRSLQARSLDSLLVQGLVRVLVRARPQAQAARAFLARRTVCSRSRRLVCLASHQAAPRLIRRRAAVCLEAPCNQVKWAHQADCLETTRRVSRVRQVDSLETVPKTSRRQRAVACLVIIHRVRQAQVACLAITTCRTNQTPEACLETTHRAPRAGSLEILKRLRRGHLALMRRIRLHPAVCLAVNLRNPVVASLGVKPRASQALDCLEVKRKVNQVAICLATKHRRSPVMVFLAIKHQVAVVSWDPSHLRV